MYLIYFAALAAKEEAVKLPLNTSLKLLTPLINSEVESLFPSLSSFCSSLEPDLVNVVN